MRIPLVVATLLFVGLTSMFDGAVVAQPAIPVPPPPALWLTGAADPRWTETFEKLSLATKASDWDSTTRLLQECFAAPPGELVVLLDKAPWSLRVVGLRGEALRRLENLPPAGRAAYRQATQPLAKALLAEGIDKIETNKLERVWILYPDTPAAAEVLRELAIRHGKAGHYHLALAALSQLERQSPVANWPTDVLVDAAILYRRAGKIGAHPGARETAEMLAKQVIARGGNRSITLLEESKARDAEIVGAASGDWLLFGGNTARAGQGAGGAPGAEARWTNKTIRSPDTDDVMKKVNADLADRKESLIPGVSPLVITVNIKGSQYDMVFFRSTWGTHGYDLQGGKLIWEVPNAWSFDYMFQVPEKRRAAAYWSEELLKNQRSPLLAENTAIGAISGDANYVFLIEDFPMPITLTTDRVSLGPKIDDARKSNAMLAYQLKSGKLTWVLDATDRGGGHVGTYFLSTPLPVDGRLYTLAEKKGQLQLLLLTPATGKTIASYPLGKMNQSLAQEPLRRVQAAHLACGGGVIVCPTNAGMVLGVDLASGDLAWSHVYRDAGTPLPATAWKVTAPMIIGDKVVFTAPDSAFLTCIRLKDGALIWKVPRTEEDVYLGGVAAGKVLVVTKSAVRALNLETGAQVWTQDTGMPSGLGAVVGDRYYVPLRDTAAGGPAVAVLDVAKGKVVEFLRTKDKLVPGNLVFADGAMVSQSATELQVFPLGK